MPCVILERKEVTAGIQGSTGRTERTSTGGFVIMDQDKKQVYFFGDSIVAQDKKIYTYPADYNQNGLERSARDIRQF